MRLFSSLRTAILVAATTLLSAGAQAGPIPTNVAAMKSMVDQNTTDVRWGGGWRGGGFGYRGGGWGYRGLGYGLIVSQQSLRIDLMYAYLVWLAVIGLTVNALVRLADREAVT